MRKAVAASQSLVTVAGVDPTLPATARQPLSGDGGGAANASLNYPAAVLVGSDNSVYVAESSSHRIRVLDGLSDTVSTIVGLTLTLT